MSEEARRIQQRYRERDAAGGESSFWTFCNPVVLHIAQERERVFWRAARDLGLDLAGIDILDVGCGAGGELLNLGRWGAATSRMFGIDLSWDRIRSAHTLHGLKVVQASGDRLPFRDGQFGAVMQNVVFSSIVSPDMRREIAAEMERVLAPGGMLLWYDASRTRGQDPAFVPVSRGEAEGLFPGISFSWYGLTTDMGLLKLARRIGGDTGMKAVAATGLFRTHLFGVGIKKGGAAHG